jgi:hypothetical protein
VAGGTAGGDGTGDKCAPLEGGAIYGNLEPEAGPGF